MDTNILILAASNPKLNGAVLESPSCLSEFHGKSVLERIIESTNKISKTEYTFAISKQDNEHFHLGRIAKLLVPNAKISVVPESTKGSACTALLAACTLPQQNSLLVISANELIDVDLGVIVLDFEQKKLDAGTLIFRSINPRYSYVRQDSQGFVVEVSQKTPISQQATAGAFWFRRTSDFLGGAKSMIRKNASINELFYVAPVFNELILDHKKIGVVEIDIANYHPLKTDAQIKQFEFRGE
jgi:hypothetical protein